MMNRVFNRGVGAGKGPVEYRDVPAVGQDWNEQLVQQLVQQQHQSGSRGMRPVGKFTASLFHVKHVIYC